MPVSAVGMWIVAETDKTSVLEWWPYRSDGNTRKPTVVLTASPALGGKQWGLVKKQFENMGIAPRDPS